MFKVEYIRTADYTYTDTDENGKPLVMLIHKKGTKVNGNHESGCRLNTSKYETQETLDRYSPGWKSRDVYIWRTDVKLNVERFTYQHINGSWKRIN